MPRGKGKKPRHTVFCDVCGTVFERWLCKVGTVNYCSHSCSYGKQGPKSIPYFWIYNKLIRAANIRKMVVHFSFDQFLEFTKITECHYCGDAIQWHKKANTKEVNHSGAYNIDRKDSNKEYTMDNSVVCCSRCNWAKSSNFSYSEWVEIGKTIRKFRES